MGLPVRSLIIIGILMFLTISGVNSLPTPYEWKTNNAGFFTL